MLGSGAAFRPDQPPPATPAMADNALYDSYALRCALLHQGRTTVPPTRGRYTSYSFIQPAPSGSKIHEWVTPDERNITLDVDTMAVEIKLALQSWFSDLQEPMNTNKLANVERHLRWLVKEKPKTLPGHSGIDMTYSSTSTST